MFTTGLQALSPRVAGLEAGQGLGFGGEDPEWFFDLLHSSMHPILIASIEENRIIDVNAAAAGACGYAREDLLGRTDVQLFRWADPGQQQYCMEKLRREGRLEGAEVCLICGSGEPRRFRYYARPIAVRGRLCMMSMLKDVLGRGSQSEALEQSERKYRTLVENSLQGFTIIQDDRFVFCNRAYCRMTGYSAEELRALYPAEMELMVHPDDRAMIRDRLQRRMAGDAIPSRYEYRGIRRNGEEFRAEVLTNLIEYKGKPAAQVSYTEITEQKLAEAEARETGERLNLALAAAGMTCWDLDIPTGDVKDDDAWMQGLGYGPHEIEPNVQSRNALIHPEDLPALIQASADHLAGRTPIYEVEYRVRTRSGSYRWVLDRGKVIAWDAAGKPLRTVGIHFDISKQKSDSEQIRQLVNEQKAVLNTLSVGIVHIRDRKVQWTNPALLGMFGYDADELQYHDTARLYSSPQDFQKIAREGYAALAGGAIYAMETFMKRKDGSQFRCSIAGQAINSAHMPEGSIWIFQDITERWRAAEVVRKNEGRFRGLLQNSNDVIVVLNDSGRSSYVSDTVQKMLGCSVEEWVGTDVFAQVHPDDRSAATRMFNDLIKTSGEIRRLELRFRHKQGSWVPIEAVGSNLLQDPQVQGIVLNMRDISERNRLQEQLQQAMKMEAVGLLAGGVAHDFNNLLSVIKGYSELLLEDMDAEDARRPDLEQIAAAGRRAADLTSQLLAFSRRQILKPAILNLNAVVAEMSRMIQRLIGEDIQFATVPGADLCMVHADPGQIQQIIMNLAVNARDAMPQGGKLTIETANVDIADAYIRQHPVVLPGQYVMIAISDTGMGMSAETQARIFEPFFTTKEKGKGTGLGLSTVYGIVKQSNGYIWVYSEPGNGTTFKVYFPRAAGDAVVPANAVCGEQELRGSETVLITEDEDSVRALACRIMRQKGYTVLEAGDGMEALRIAGEFAGRIDLILTDVIMPGMSGKELVTQLEEARPGIRSLYISGYTETAIVHHGLLDSDIAFLQKPFETEGLLRKVREVIDSPHWGRTTVSPQIH